MRTLKSSIFWKIYIVNLLVIISLLGLIYFKAKNSLPEISREEHQRVTDETVERLKGQINNITFELNELGSFIQTKGFFMNESKGLFNEKLEEIVTFSNIIDSGTVLDINGDVLGFYPTDLKVLENKNLGDREYFQKVLQTKDIYISNVINASTNRFIVVTSVPIFNDKRELQYVVNLSMRIQDNPLIKSIIQHYNLGDGYAYIVDKEGRLISHPQTDRIGEDVSGNPVVKKSITGQTGYEKVVNTKGNSMYASYQHIPVLDWGVIAQVPIEYTYKYFQSFLKSFLIFSIILVLFLSILTAIYARQLIKPLQKLHQAVDRVANGDFKQRIEQINKTEVGKLSKRFNEMIEHIQQAQIKIQNNEKHIIEQKEFLKKIIDISPNFIYVKDYHGKFTLVNQAYANFYGKKAEEFLTKKESDFVDDKEQVTKSINEDRQIINKREGILIREEIIKDLNGNSHWIQKSKMPIIDNDGNVDQIICIAVDITERHLAEDIIRKADKLAVVGELAAGIAHEIRNPLTSVKGFLQLLKPNYQDKYYFDIMLSELDRMNVIISELLILSKPQAISFEEKNVSAICKRIIDLFESQAILNNVKIISEFEPNIPLIQCEENQLKQVFVNVIKNSMEALPDNGGSIKVQITRESKDWVKVCFADNGSGISEERLQRLGEPFYSTKEKGTGLGLMVSYKIIENHKGHIKITSSKGNGTTVQILLPVDFK